MRAAGRLPAGRPPPMFRRHSRSPLGRCACVSRAVLASAVAAAAAFSQESQPAPDGGIPRDLGALSLEDLLKVEVTSASRKSEPIHGVPAAIFVLTHDDLRRSGATSIPEALRLVPGMDVARLDSNRWAVSARGFKDQFANKMLVMIDGRSVYTPLFSGVWWDEVDVPFDDIERIEVIRGPGAAMWGANAVNGVISIITREAAKTQGALLEAGVGNMDKSMLYARYGGHVDNGHWRVYGKYFDRDSTATDTGIDAEDDWQVARGGFRSDLSFGDKDQLLVEGDAYQGDVHNRLVLPSPNPPFQVTPRNLSNIDGWSLLSRWTRRSSENSEFQLSASADGSARETSIFVEDRTTQSIDLQQRFVPFARHEIIWGMSYRSTQADTQGSYVITLSDNHRTDELYGAFVQDDIDLAHDRCRLILGTKFEKNDYTAWEFQPNARLVFTPSNTQTVWASVSRAVRTPSQIEDDVSLVQAVIPGAPNQVVTLFGNGDLNAERLTAYELGYRIQPLEQLALDLATFYNDYSNLIVFEPGTPFLSGGGDLIIPLTADNLTQGHSYGAELAAEWAPRSDTRVKASYSFIELVVDDTPNTPAKQGDEVPENQIRLRVEHDLNEHTELDLGMMYVDSLESGNIDSYFRTDCRAQWRPSTHLSLTLGVQNVFHNGQVEAGPAQFGPSSESRTAAYLKASWNY